MQVRVRNILLGLALVALLAVGGMLQARRAAKHAIVEAFNAILAAEQEVQIGTDSAYVPREIAAEEALARARSLVFVDSQRAQITTLENYLALLRFARDNRNKTVKLDNWAASFHICHVEVREAVGSGINFPKPRAAALQSVALRNEGCWQQRAERTQEIRNNQEEEVAPLLTDVPTGVNNGKN